MALSRVQKLEDMILWDFCPSAIHLLQFYKDLLKWCDYADAIRPTPSIDVIAFPNRCDDISNAPFGKNPMPDNPYTCPPDNEMTSTGVFFCTQKLRKRKTQNNPLPPHKRYKNLEQSTSLLHLS